MGNADKEQHHKQKWKLQRHVEAPHSGMHTEVVRNFCRQDIRSEILLVDTKQVLEEEIHFVKSEHSIVQTKENLNYTKRWGKSIEA